MPSQHKLRLFDSPSEIPPAGPEPTLFVGGFTLIACVGLRLERGALTRAYRKGLIPDVTGEKSYTEKLLGSTALHYSALLPAGELPPIIAAAADASPGPIKQSVVWLDPEYALLVSHLAFSVRRPNQPWRAIQMDRPLSVVELMAVLRVVTRADIASSMAAQAVDTLVDGGVLEPDEVLKRVPITDALALQLWDLEGSKESHDGPPRPAQRYQGVEESRRYAWEISALLSYCTDHLIADGLWRNRRPEQVFSEVSEGYAFLDDHMVFVNHSCCLEISHLTADPERALNLPDAKLRIRLIVHLRVDGCQSSLRRIGGPAKRVSTVSHAAH